MVDALREGRRVLTPGGILIDVRPVTLPMAVEVVIGAQAVWVREVNSCSAPEDVAAADAAVQLALSCEWFDFEKSLTFDVEIYCDSAADLSQYAQARKIPEAEIPYGDLEAQRLYLSAGGPTARLRCRRAWGLSTYRKKQVLGTA